MSEEVIKIFESILGKNELIKKTKYFKNDVLSLLEKDNHSTGLILNDIFQKYPNLFSAKKNEKITLLEKAINKKNKVFIDFLISKKFHLATPYFFSKIVKYDFKEILPILNNNHYKMNSSEWNNLCSTNKSDFILEIIKNNRELLSEVSRNNFISNLLRFIYSKGNSIEPLFLVKNELNEEDKYYLWSYLLSSCNSVELHKKIIESGILPNTTIFYKKPLLIHILSSRNISVFDLYSGNEELVKDAKKFLMDMVSPVFSLNRDLSEYEIKKINFLFKDITINDDINLLPNVKDFYNSNKEEVLKFIDIIKNNELLFPMLFKPYNKETPNLYFYDLYKEISEISKDKFLKKAFLSLEKSYLETKINPEIIDKNNNKRL